MAGGTGEFVLFGGNGAASVASVNAEAADGEFTLWGNNGSASAGLVSNQESGEYTLWGGNGAAFGGEVAFGGAPIVFLGTDTAEFNVNLSMVPQAEQVEFDIVLQMLEYGTANMNIDLLVFDPSFVDANPLCWSVKVTLDGVDISTDLIGAVRVTAEEGLARTASFTMRPTGTIEVTDWVGKPVTVEFQQIDSLGNPLVSVRVFTGIVDVPQFDPTRVLVEFNCIDNLNGVLGQQTRAAIDQLIGGFWSPFVFEPDSNSLDYALQQISTVPKALDMNAYQQLRVTPWAAKVTPDFVLTAADQVVDDSVSFEVANRSEIKNCVNADFQYRFPRLRARRVGVSWAMPRLDVLIFDLINFTIPTKSMVESAAKGLGGGGGWQVLSINYVEPPVSQVFNPGNIIWLCDPPVAALLAWAVGVTLARKWVQTITEVYRYKVLAPASISDVGEICEDSTFSAEVGEDVFDAAGWEADPKRQPTPSYLVNIESAAPPWTRALASDAVAFDTTAYGADFFFDVTNAPPADRPEVQNAIETQLNVAKTLILNSHRQSRLTCTAPLNPFVDLIHTIEVDTPKISGKGKAVGITYEMDIDAGKATMTVDIAISGTAFVGAQVDDPIPAPPTPPAPTYTPPIPKSGSTLFGADGASQFPQPNVESFPIGYLGNRTDTGAGGNGYNENNRYVPEFRLQAPAIPDELTQPLEIEVFGETPQGEFIVTEINVEIPQDDLTLTGA